MTDRSLLVVEGAEDQRVVRAIATRHAFPREFQVLAEGAWETLLARMPIHLKPGTELERFGIIVDAEADIQARWLEIKRTLEQAGYDQSPDDPDPAGTIIDDEDLPRVGVWIMPDNRSPGRLVDYLMDLVPEGDSLFERARRCVDEIPAEDRRFAEAHLNQAIVHTWLAWQDDPGTSFGQAFQERYFAWDGPPVQSLMDWLTRLFA